MTPEKYSRLQNLFIAAAILSALVFDRFAAMRVPAALVGVAAAVAAMLAYFLRKDASNTESSRDKQAVKATVRNDEDRVSQASGNPVNNDWYLYNAAMDLHSTNAHYAAHHDALDQLAQDSVVLFEPGAIQELLRSSVITARHAQVKAKWGRVGGYELLVTRDCLFAVRHTRGRKRSAISTLGPRFGHRHHDLTVEDDTLDLPPLTVAKTG